MSQKNISIGAHESFRINLLILGEPGVGKRTLLKTLLKPFVHDDNFNFLKTDKHKTNKPQGDSKNHCSLARECSAINEESIVEMKTGNGHVFLHLLHAINYGTNINNSDCINLLAVEIERRMEAWRMVDFQLLTESDRGLSDERIHGIFYFIAPHQFKSLDKEFFQKISKLVPVIPIVSKADTMTPQECNTFLAKISSELHGLKELQVVATGEELIYDFRENFDVKPQLETQQKSVGGPHFHSSSSRAIPETNSFEEDEEECPQLSPSIGDYSPVAASDGSFSRKYFMNMNMNMNTCNSLSETRNATSNYEGEEFESIYSRRLGIKLALSPTCGTSLSSSTESYDQVEEVENLKQSYQMDTLSGDHDAIGDDHDPKNSDEDSGMQFGIEREIDLGVEEAEHSHMDSTNIFAVIGMSRVYDWGTVSIESDQFDTKRLQRLIFDEGHLGGIKRAAQLKMIAHYKNRRVANEPFIDLMVKSWCYWLFDCSSRVVSNLADFKFQFTLIEKCRSIRELFVLKYLVMVWESKLCCLLAPLLLGSENFQKAIFPWLFWVFSTVANAYSSSLSVVSAADMDTSSEGQSKTANTIRIRRTRFYAVSLLCAALLCQRAHQMLFPQSSSCSSTSTTSTTSSSLSSCCLRKAEPKAEPTIVGQAPSTMPSTVPLTVTPVSATGDIQNVVKLEAASKKEQPAGIAKSPNDSNSEQVHSTPQAASESIGKSIAACLKDNFLEALNARGFGYI